MIRQNVIRSDRNLQRKGDEWSKQRLPERGEMRVKYKGDADISTPMFGACFVFKNVTWSKGKKERWELN